MRIATKDIIKIGLFAAILTVLSQVAFSLPTGVPITLQTFAVALTGVMLGTKKGTMATVVYVLLGCIGIPVFANFKGGFQVIAGPTGGFIIGLIFMTALCGFAIKKNKLLNITFCLLGLTVCHFCGVLMYAKYADISIAKSLVAVSVPYLIKDIISVIAAYGVGAVLKNRIKNFE